MKFLIRIAVLATGTLIFAMAFGAGFMMLLCARYGDNAPHPDEEYLF